MSELDPLDHVNNAVYVDWLDEALVAAGWSAATALPRTARIEYLASAERGDEVAVELYGDAAAGPPSSAGPTGSTSSGPPAAAESRAGR